MLFTIVFNENGLTLNTTDMETAFHACDMPQLVSAVINAETGKILWGSLEHHAKSAETKKKVGGITRADKPIVPWYRLAEASQQYVNAIGPCVTPSNRNFTVVVLYDYEPAWVGSFHEEDVAFDFFEQRVKNKRTVMLYKGSRLVCRAFNGVKEAQQ